MATNSVVQINEVAYFKPQVVQKVDNSIHWINNFPVEKGIFSFLIYTYPADGDLSGG